GADLTLRILEADGRDHAARRRQRPRSAPRDPALLQRRRIGRIGQSTKRATHLIKVSVDTALGLRPKVDVFGTDYPTPDPQCGGNSNYQSNLSNGTRSIRLGPFN